MANNLTDNISYELLGRVIDSCATPRECNQVLRNILHNPKMTECITIALHAKFLTINSNSTYETI